MIRDLVPAEIAVHDVLENLAALRRAPGVENQRDEAQLREWALTNERVQGFIEGKSVRKVIVVAGKLVNVVV